MDLDGPFLCEYCSEILASSKCLDRHLKTHELKDYRFLCYVCDQSFKSRVQLTYHERRHKTVKLHTCKYCDRKSFNRGSLVFHLESVHARKKPFHCDKCDVGFSLSMEYNAHVASHDVETLLACPLCYRCFSQPLNLSLHMKKRHNIREIFRTKGVTLETHPFLNNEQWPFMKFIERMDSRGQAIYHCASKKVLKNHFNIRSLAHLFMEKYPFLQDNMIKDHKVPKHQSYVKTKRRKIQTAKKIVVSSKKLISFRTKLKKLFTTYSVLPLMKRVKKLKEYAKDIRKEIRKLQSKSGLSSSQPLTKKLLCENIPPATSKLSSFVGLIPHNDLVHATSADSRVVPCIVRVLPQTKSSMNQSTSHMVRRSATRPPPPPPPPVPEVKPVVRAPIQFPCLVRARKQTEQAISALKEATTPQKTPKKTPMAPRRERVAAPIYARRLQPNIITKPQTPVAAPPPVNQPLDLSPVIRLPPVIKFVPTIKPHLETSPLISAPMSRNAYQKYLRNIIFPDRVRMNINFPIPTLSAKSLAELSKCSYDDLYKFVEDFSRLLVNEYFLSIFSPLQLPSYFIGNPPPTLSPLPQSVLKDLITKQVNGLVVRRKYLEEICRHLPAEPKKKSPPSNASTGSLYSGESSPSSSSTISSGSNSNDSLPKKYAATFNKYKQQSTLVKPLVNPSPIQHNQHQQQPSTSSNSQMFKPHTSMASNVNKSVAAEIERKMKSFQEKHLPSSISNKASPVTLAKPSTLPKPGVVQLPRVLPNFRPCPRSEKPPGYIHFDSISSDESSGPSSYLLATFDIKNWKESVTLRIILPRLHIPLSGYRYKVISGGFALKKIQTSTDEDEGDETSQIVTKKSISTRESLMSGQVYIIPGGFLVRKNPKPGFDKIPKGFNIRKFIDKSKPTSPKRLEKSDIKKESKLTKRKRQDNVLSPRSDTHYPIRSRVSSSSSIDVNKESTSGSSDKVKTSDEDDESQHALRGKTNTRRKEVPRLQPTKKLKPYLKVKVEESSEEDCEVLDRSGEMTNWGVEKEVSLQKSDENKDKIGLQHVENLELLLENYSGRRLTRSRAAVVCNASSEVTHKRSTRSSRSSSKTEDLAVSKIKQEKTSEDQVQEEDIKPDLRKLQQQQQQNYGKKDLLTVSSKTSSESEASKFTNTSKTQTEDDSDYQMQTETSSTSSCKKKSKKVIKPKNSGGVSLSDSDEMQTRKLLPTRQAAKSAKFKLTKNSESSSESELSEGDSSMDSTLMKDNKNGSRDGNKNRKRKRDTETETKTHRKTESEDDSYENSITSTSNDFRKNMPSKLRKFDKNPSPDINSSVSHKSSLSKELKGLNVDEVQTVSSSRGGSDGGESLGLDEPSTSRVLRKQNVRNSNSPTKVTITNELRKAKIKMKKNEPEIIPKSSLEFSEEDSPLKSKFRNQQEILKKGSSKQKKFDPLVVDVKNTVTTTTTHSESNSPTDSQSSTSSKSSNNNFKVSPVSTDSSSSGVASKRLRSWNLCNRK